MHLKFDATAKATINSECIKPKKKTVEKQKIEKKHKNKISTLKLMLQYFSNYECSIYFFFHQHKRKYLYIEIKKTQKLKKNHRKK